MADLCPICKFPIERHEQPGYISEPFCSEFCSVATQEQKAKFVAGLPEGEFALYPCTESGCAIEDGYSSKSGCCGSCSDKRKARVRGELLERVLPLIGPSLSMLIEEIEAELKR